MTQTTKLLRNHPCPLLGMGWVPGALLWVRFPVPTLHPTPLDTRGGQTGPGSRGKQDAHVNPASEGKTSDESLPKPALGHSNGASDEWPWVLSCQARLAGLLKASMGSRKPKRGRPRPDPSPTPLVGTTGWERLKSSLLPSMNLAWGQHQALQGELSTKNGPAVAQDPRTHSSKPCLEREMVLALYTCKH